MEKITWVCANCGRRFGNYLPSVATWHEDICDICGRKIAVTESRDFGGIIRETFTKQDYKYLLSEVTKSLDSIAGVDKEMTDYHKGLIKKIEAKLSKLGI